MGNNDSFVFATMKKFTVTILAVFYLATSSGATFHFHYCMGKLVEWTLGHNNSDKCGKCGMKKDMNSKNGCCKDETRQFKIDKDQKQSGVISTLNPPITGFILSANFPFLPTLPENDKLFLTRDHAPPGIPTIPLHIINCLFRI
jgi:hypothetical protein